MNNIKIDNSDLDSVYELHTYCLVAASGRMNQTQQVINFLERYDLRFNTANHKMQIRHKGEEQYQYLTDEILNSVKVLINLDNISCSRETLRTIIYSNQFESFDPYRKWLDSLPVWDGEDHIAELAATVKTADDDYWAWVFRKWIVTFCASLADEKVVNQVAFIFCGGQGIGKSTWIQNIIPEELKEYTSSGFINPKDKETLIQLSELALYNLDECENLKAKHVEALKELITKPQMYLRRAYTTLSATYPRRCSFCGTANGTAILHDLTGNRRFACMEVKEIDYQFDVDLGQVYAQAYQLFRSGKFQYWFDADDQKVVEKQNAKFRHISMEEEVLTTYFEPCTLDDEGAKLLQAHELLQLLKMKSHFNSLSPETLGKLLTRLGFLSKKSGVKRWIVKERDISKED